MLWGTYHHQNGDLINLLKWVRKKVPQSAGLSEGGGCDCYLGNAQMHRETFSGGFPNLPHFFSYFIIPLTDNFRIL